MKSSTVNQWLVKGTPLTPQGDTDMAFKMTTKEKEELQKIRVEAENAWTNYYEAVEDAERLRQLYEGKREIVLETVGTIAERFRSEFNDKSDKWQESDAGQEAEDFIREWEGFSEGMEETEQLQLPGDDLTTALDSLPEEQP